MGTISFPIQTTSRRARKAGHVRACRSNIDAGQGRKSKPLRVPPGKIVQAQALLVQGHSQREIGRALHMSPMTVAKIIRTEDFQSFIAEMREKLFAIAPEALESFRTQVKMDGHPAYVFMKDVGIVPSRESLVTLMNPTSPQMETGEERQARMIAAVLLEGREHLGVTLPDELEKALGEEPPACKEGAKTAEPKLPRR